MKAPGQNLVLIIDENSRDTAVLSSKLNRAGYDTELVQGTDDALRRATAISYETIILNRAFSDMTGMDICKSLRERGIATPLFMLCDTPERVNIIRCLELGADDCLSRPFSYNELIARLGALIRRSHKTFTARWVQKNGVKLDIENHIIYSDRADAKLTHKEMLLLRRLMHEAPNPISRDELLQDIWGIDDLHTSNRLDVYIRRLRAKLEKVGRADYVKTARGHGYYIDSNEP